MIYKMEQIWSQWLDTLFVDKLLELTKNIERCTIIAKNPAKNRHRAASGNCSAAMGVYVLFLPAVRLLYSTTVSQ